jgi:ketosteroid isomerase-like protein/heme-degrading monooxygenase HmoA
MPNVRISYLTAKAGQEDVLESCLRSNVEEISQHPGSDGTELLRDDNNVCRFAFIERWSSQASYERFSKIFSKKDMTELLNALEGPWQGGSFEQLKEGFSRQSADVQKGNRQLALDFIAAIQNGDMPDDLLTPDMTSWMTAAGTVNKSTYQNMIKMLSKVCARPLTFTIKSLTAEDDRIVIEAVSDGKLINGEGYRNTYVFVIRVQDGRIAAVSEHYDAALAKEKFAPLMKEMMS